MNRFFSRHGVITLCVLLMAATGCARSGPTKFYVLSPLPSSKAETKSPTGQRSIAIGIELIEMPKYLDRPQIVTRRNPNELELSEFNRWAEPLDNNFSRVLGQNLSALLGADPINPVSIFPFRGLAPIDYRVEVGVIRLDGTLGDTASLVARWAIFGADGKEALSMRESTFNESTGGPGYEALVSAESRAVATLSREIAGAIKTILQKTPRK